MEESLAIWAMIWVVLAIINIVTCVKANNRYKKLRREGAVMRISLSWVIILGGIIFGSVFAALVDTNGSATGVVVQYCTAYVGEFIAIGYTNSAAR